MSTLVSMRLAQRGILTLPKELRETYGLKDGDELTLLDLGGTFVLTPRRAEVDILADRIADALKENGESLESMLHVVREERERYGRKS